MIARCNTANSEAEDLKALRKWMARDGVMLRAEELARFVQLKAVATYQNAFAEEAVLSGVAHQMDRMGFADADTIERMLILQVGPAWLMLQTVQEQLAWLEGEGGHSLRRIEALSR